MVLGRYGGGVFIFFTVCFFKRGSVGTSSASNHGEVISPVRGETSGTVRSVRCSLMVCCLL